eukprot:symbB.v1.2.015795.t1/scaffold1190.1/size132987/4
MVILESGAAVAAAGMAPGTAAKVYGYNRDNFMEDREQRMKKEFHERKYRVIQGQLWRQDVRDFISLTEQKMSLYLIINVLLLSFTVTMWVEGQLPETTPDWLVIGYQIASVVAFSYLVLTIWLAMHAAVAAQSYQTRVLTQLVRLPIPTWQELEAARTAASEFEKIESRQMFRVPFVTGSQESFVPGHTADPRTDVSSVASVVETTGNTGGTDQQVDRSVATDPWGLEQRGDNIYELNTYSGKEVAELRHIKLLRQAAVYWQTYDAFARVSMSVGINQLMLGMSYYILGYAMLEVKAPCAALGGVLAFMGSSESATKKLEGLGLHKNKTALGASVSHRLPSLPSLKMALRLGKRTLRTFRPLAHRLQVRRASAGHLEFDDFKQSDSIALTAKAAPFKYEELFDLHANEVPTEYRKLSSDGISTCTVSSGEKLLKVESHVLESMTHEAIVDVQHLFRPAHLQMLSNILKDPEASSNDRFVALELLKNACVDDMSLQSACCGEIRPKISSTTEVIMPHNFSGVLEGINDGLGRAASWQQQLKNMALVHRDILLRQERRLKEMGEELALPGDQKRRGEDQDHENEKGNATEHDEKEVQSTCTRCEVPKGPIGPECRRVQLTQVAQVALEIPQGEPAVGHRVSKAITARSSPRFGQRFVTNETSQDTVTFEIAGLSSTASPRKTMARARQMASNTALGRYFFDRCFNMIELFEQCRRGQ